MIDEGYIKFECEWINEKVAVPVPDELKFWRDKMHQLKLIGHYEEINIGYGNISIKTDKGILISGTQTGEVYPITDTHFTLVDNYDIKKNWVHCQGPIKASSESMTHAAIYEADQSIQAIIHIHNKKLWDQLMDKIPATRKDVPYGTPAMALEISRLFATTNVSEKKILVMGGHEEGVIVFGKDLAEAGEVLLHFLT